MRWTIAEDIKLHGIARKHYQGLVKSRCIKAGSEISKAIHDEFASEQRDEASLLFRLKDAGVLKYAGKPGRGTNQQLFTCKLQDDVPLYDFTVCPKELKKAVNPITVSAVLDRFQAINDSQAVSEVVEQIADELMLESMQVEKVLVEQKQIIIDKFRNYVQVHETSTSSPKSLTEVIQAQTPLKKVIDDINICRTKTFELYEVHERDGAEVIFSSDGTGFGKSYGVIEGYVDYIERFNATQDPASVIPDRGFTNLLFMSPQKSQINLVVKQKRRILSARGEFICVIARKDIYDLDFVNWATEQTNRDRYLEWYEGGKGSKYIGSTLRNLKYLVGQIDRCNEQIQRLTSIGTSDALDEKEMAEDQLFSAQQTLARTIQKACKTLFDRENSKLLLLDYIHRGLLARRRREERAEIAKQKGKKPPKLAMEEVYLEIIKQVLPFEVCQYRPSVLLMTTNKFDTTTKRVVSKEWGEGTRFKDVPFDHMIGGKVRAEDPRISTVSGATHQEQVDYLRDEHFEADRDCPFRARDVRFTVVIDELHEAYVRLEDSCHVKLVSKENNLAHVFSVTRRIHQEVKSLEARGVPEEALKDFEREGSTFITALRDLLQDKCELSTDTTLESFLNMFSDQLGAFEVNGDSAERIISITRNIFSFNAKMFVNEHALKRIRMRHVNGNLTRTELYYEVEGDTSDTNPTLHDLFQLVSAILAACSKITNPCYKRWVKNGGQDKASSQNMPLSQFVDAANNVAGEVRHIFDRTTDDDMEIDHFYTYLQPKTVFTLTPVDELNFYNKGAERTVILAFEMDLIKELPEAMLLRLLSGTNNKVIGLSATSGFTHTKNGNFSRDFLNRYARDFGYQVVERQPSDIAMLEALRELRASIRGVVFTSFDAEQTQLTDTYQTSPDFRTVYDKMYTQLADELKFTLRNPYKRRQICRELEALLLASYDRKNTLVLSLSGEFKGAFARAYRNNLTSWRKQYGMVWRCDGKAEKRHDKIFEFTPFKGGHKLRLVFFDSPLASVTDVKAETYVTEKGMSLVFMSTYNSAGTGLNYFVKYHDGDIDDPDALALEVDFQRLVLVNSSFYSEVMNGTSNLNTLPNYVSLLKHFADDTETHLMRDLSVNFAQGENYRLLMAEHCISLFKVIVQAVGRVERRDTLLKNEILLPSDVMHNAAFQFAGLSEDVGNEVVLESMSLLNYRLKEYCETLSAKHSFRDADNRVEFEKRMLVDCNRIDQVHKKILKMDWINKVRAGKREYLAICNLFRDPASYANPAAWLAKLKANPIFSSNKQMMAILDIMFISRRQEDETIMLCHKRGPDGLPAKQFGALSDFAGGAREYRPELMIFPQYAKNVDYANGDVVGKVTKHFEAVQNTAFNQWVPHPAMVPLLKGNVGEAMFDMIVERYQVTAMSDAEVFQRLDPVVYEFFDRFFDVDRTLVCVDVKNWGTKLDNFERAEETIDKGGKKIRQVRDLAVQKMDHDGEEQIRKAIGGRYNVIKFVYLNAAYSQNPNNLMWEDNVDHTVHYLNLFQADHEYYRPSDREKKCHKDQFKLGNKLRVNPQLLSLLGI